MKVRLEKDAELYVEGVKKSKELSNCNGFEMKLKNSLG